MFTVFTTADELTQSFAVFKTYPSTMNQNLFRLSLYILMSRKNRSSAIKVNNIMQLFYISSVRVTWFYKEKVAEIRHVIFCNICLNEEIVPWAPSFSICNCFTCLWQFQQLLAKKKRAPLECCTFTSCCNEATENKEKQREKLSSLFGQHMLCESLFENHR